MPLKPVGIICTKTINLATLDRFTKSIASNHLKRLIWGVVCEYANEY
jgi:hypothetical protein